MRYELFCARRGYYQLGPLRIKTGDLLGILPELEGQIASDPLIVYPRIVLSQSWDSRRNYHLVTSPAGSASSGFVAVFRGARL